MPSEKILAAKKQVVADLVASCKDSASFVFVAARGLTVLQDTEMRSELRKNNVTYKVVKNTTLRLVFKELGIEGLDDMLVGPTAVAYSDDIIAPAKVLANYAEKIAVLEIKGGIIEGKALSPVSLSLRTFLLPASLLLLLLILALAAGPPRLRRPFIAKLQYGLHLEKC